jgi:hypothetical protein
MRKRAKLKHIESQPQARRVNRQLLHFQFRVIGRLCGDQVDSMGDSCKELIYHGDVVILCVCKSSIEEWAVTPDSFDRASLCDSYGGVASEKRGNDRSQSRLLLCH